MIFEPLKIGTHTVKNRIAVPPLVVFGLPEAEGEVQDAHIGHYLRMAEGGAGLLIVESVTTDPVHEKRAMISAFDDRFIPGLTRLAKACRQNDVIALVQITNTGLELMPYNSLKEIPAEEFKRYRDQFTESAERCFKAGFTGVELHCAHGFYMNQVLEVNDRDDEFADGKAVLAGMIRDIKERCGKEFIVDVRIGHHDIEELIRIAKCAEEAGADMLHISRGAWDDGDNSLSKHEDGLDEKLLHSSAPAETAPDDFGYEHTVYMASRVKPEVNIPVLCVGGIRKATEAEDILEKGIADMVALGRQHLADPEWTNKVSKNEEPDYCLNCTACKWMDDGTGAKCAARILAKRKREAVAL